jgi:DNA-binding MarR family transcriptional regulator
MAPVETVDALEAIIIAGVAMTTKALASVRSASDLTLPMWRVLVVLGGRAEGAKVSEVARRIGVTLPATSRQLRRLEHRGLVSLAPDEHDRRALRCRMTDAGAALRAAVMGHRRAALVEALGNVEVSAATSSDLEAIAVLLAAKAA